MMFKQTVILAVALLAAAGFDDVAVSATERRLKKGKGMPGPGPPKPGPPPPGGYYYYNTKKVKTAKKNSKKNLPTMAPTPAPVPKPPTRSPVSPTPAPIPMTMRPTFPPTFPPIPVTRSVVDGMAAPPGINTVDAFNTVLTDTTLDVLGSGRRDRQLRSLLQRSLETSGCDVESQSEQFLAESAGCFNFFTPGQLVGVQFCYEFKIIISSTGGPSVGVCDVNMAAEVVLTAALKGEYDETVGTINDVKITQTVPTAEPISTSSPSFKPTVEPTKKPTVEPTKAPIDVEMPTYAPVTPTPAPVNPTPAPVKPTPAPVKPTPAPVKPTPAPVKPTPAPVPETPDTPAPVIPETPAPVIPDTPAPVIPVTPAPVPVIPVSSAPTPASSPDGSPNGTGSGSPDISGVDSFVV